MDAATVAALAGRAAQLNVLYVVVGLFVIVGAFGFLIALGERTLGFDLRGFIDNVEAVAKRGAQGEPAGSVWPGVALVLGVMALLGLVIFVGLR